ncbi:hypothetical protein RMCBS344292_12144 [Rhizopus microsporus]|nr:hypothetical protein RMCBS344292_12144 [Rhizopus microsporus]
MATTQDNHPPIVLSQQSSLLYTLLNRIMLPIDPAMTTDLTPTLDFMLLFPTTATTAPFKPIVKDDVFLAEPWIDHDDNASLSSHSSLKSPCLSPVTSPTNFLYNHEPLFDGIEDQLFIKEEEKEHDDQQVIPTKEPSQRTDRLLLINNNNNNEQDTEYDHHWFNIFDTFHTHTTNEPHKRKRADSNNSIDWLEKPCQQKRRKKIYKKTQFLTRKKSISGFQMNDQYKQDCQVVEPIEGEDRKTMFQQLTESGIDWCRYCGTTEGVNWRPGPWGKRTLCNKHGCDYKGYGLASRLPRLDLSKFQHENIYERQRPVVQLFCNVCHSPEEEQNNKLVMCDGGCSRAYHQQCYSPVIEPCPTMYWYCNATCKENRQRNKVGKFHMLV